MTQRDETTRHSSLPPPMPPDPEDPAPEQEPWDVGTLRRQWERHKTQKLIQVFREAMEDPPPPWGFMDGDLLVRSSESDWSLANQLDFFFKMGRAQHRFFRMHRSINSVTLPVLVLTVLVLLYVEVILLEAEEQDELIFLTILPYTQPSGDSTGRKIGGSLLNALLVLAAAITFTLLFIFLFATKRYKLLLGVLSGSICLLLWGPWCYFAWQFVWLYQVPTEALTFVLLSLNFCAATGFGLLVVGMRYPASWFHRGVLMLLGLGVAWPFLEFPEISVWLTLVVLGLYDLAAVLAPCGPLRYFAENDIQEGGFDKSQLPGLMYTGTYFSLGLGDLIFYTVLLGRAARHGWITAVSVLIAIVVGVYLTILWAYSSTAAVLPALPISITLGLIVYALARSVIEPFLEDMSQQGLFV